MTAATTAGRALEFDDEIGGPRPTPAAVESAQRPDVAAEAAVQAANELLAALHFTPLHKETTLAALANFDPEWWPTDTHRRVFFLASNGARLPADIDPTFAAAIQSGPVADIPEPRIQILRDDYARREWVRTRQAIRLACDLGATRQEIRILLDDSEAA